jgi:polysaccharide export outer membrane protein
LGGLALSASTGLSAQTAPTAPLDLAVDTTAPNSNSAIAPLDHLTVTVWREPDMSVEDAVVDESGQLTVPLAGSVMAAGKSTASLSQEIAGKLGEYLKSPQVSVTLKQAASRRVTVAGSVMQPGVYPIDGRITLLQAVALARGPAKVASLDQVFIFRTRNGQRNVARFNLAEIAKGKANDPEVISGDTVSVGASGFKTAWRDVLETVNSFSLWRIVP